MRQGLEQLQQVCTHQIVLLHFTSYRNCLASGPMQSPPLPASSVAQQPFQTPPPSAMGQPQMPPVLQSPHMSPHMSPQMSPPQSPPANMQMAGQPMSGPPMSGPPIAGPPMTGMGRPFPGPPAPGARGFQQPGPGVVGPPGYPQQAGNCDTVNQKRLRSHQSK